MLISHLRYAFIVSVDEIMFLRFEIIEKVEYPSDRNKLPIDLFSEPWLHYSAPCKLADVLEDDNGLAPAKVALLYMLLRVSEDNWFIAENVGNSAKYRGKTKVGQKWVPNYSFMIRRGN